ncbi:phosphatidylserine decarboxylase family protein [Myroides sp. NP-2]|uniref:phosphatidylserine decarboxylase family protein n=1 Tax=Myroides sp. NP-2 TaxID=2759945 RepID=UPI0015FBAFC7|nr:phosphatidylserine decarboxylase family protein [Myroides sp. NP-2]MBB1149670.1 phosphatidylserine decarboxylase family protein [Myroides sp. NP-2]
MKIHKEGRGSIAIASIVLLLVNGGAYYLISEKLVLVKVLVLLITLGLWGLVIFFFRIPSRVMTKDEGCIVAPCDGTVVVIEEVEADEYFTEKRLQVSVFMSVFNVHVNLNPIQGEVVYSQYHKGKHLVAWHPKSSTENERHSVVYRHKNGQEVLAKQIAGALANRIVNYLTPKTVVEQTDQMGFIKFGSRVDLLLPISCKVEVKLGDKVQGGVTPLAKWQE